MRVANPSCVVTSKAASLGWLSRLLETALNLNGVPYEYKRQAAQETSLNANKARTWFSRPTSTIRASLLLRSLWLTKAAAAVRGPGAMANQCVRRPLQQTPARSPA